MKLSKAQTTIAKDDHRFKVAICGRRFGKTYLAIREMCYRAKDPDQNVWYITSSYRAAKMIVWKPLKNKLLDLKWVAKINESELSIELKNGSTISLKGADNYDSLRGSSISYVVLDEVSEIPPNAWTEVIRPALADQQGGALFIGTPKGKGNWSFDLYNQREQQPDIWSSFQFTTLDGGRVKSEEVEQARADMSERQFRQEFLATFESYEGRIAHNFIREDHIKELDNPDTRIIEVGCDFNVSPITATIGIRKGDNLYIIDEILMHNSNTQELAEEIRNRYPTSKVFCYPDPAGSARKSSANGHTDHTILQNAGFIVKAPRKHDPVRDRINALNARLLDANKERHLYITKNAKYTIESLEKYTYKEGTQIPDKDSGYDHIFDALTYCIAYLFPVRKNTTQPTQPQRWGAKIY
jgi:PBSX family phage terminase large subunit